MNIILLSGGSGKRLWPLSNDVRSKQFLKVLKCNNGGYESMVQRVYRQIKTAAPDARVTIATGKKQVSSIVNQLGDKVSVCVEPARRDTFPAIALAGAYLASEKGVLPNEAVVVCPVDPYTEEEYFLRCSSLQKRRNREKTICIFWAWNPRTPRKSTGISCRGYSGEIAEG